MKIICFAKKNLYCEKNISKNDEVTDGCQQDFKKKYCKFFLMRFKLIPPAITYSQLIQTEGGGQNRPPEEIFYENHENLQKLPKSVTKRVEKLKKNFFLMLLNSKRA